MTRKYRLERTAFIGCRNTAYMDVDDAEPCPFCGSRQVTIYPYGQGTTSYVEGVPEDVPRQRYRPRMDPYQLLPHLRAKSSEGCIDDRY